MFLCFCSRCSPSFHVCTCFFSFFCAPVLLCCCFREEGCGSGVLLCFPCLLGGVEEAKCQGWWGPEGWRPEGRPEGGEAPNLEKVRVTKGGSTQGGAAKGGEPKCLAVFPSPAQKYHNCFSVSGGLLVECWCFLGAFEARGPSTCTVGLSDHLVKPRRPDRAAGSSHKMIERAPNVHI